MIDSCQSCEAEMLWLGLPSSRVCVACSVWWTAACHSVRRHCEWVYLCSGVSFMWSAWLTTAIIRRLCVGFIISIIIYPLTMRVIGAPLRIWQPDSSIFLCSPLPSGTWQTPDLSISWCCLPTSFSVCLVFFPLSLGLERWFWSDLMNGRQVHTC